MYYVVVEVIYPFAIKKEKKKKKKCKSTLVWNLVVLTYFSFCVCMCASGRIFFSKTVCCDLVHWKGNRLIKNFSCYQYFLLDVIFFFFKFVMYNSEVPLNNISVKN